MIRKKLAPDLIRGGYPFFENITLKQQIEAKRRFGMRSFRFMRQPALAIVGVAIAAIVSSAARADMVGAAAGAGSGLVVAGPVGAVAGGVVGAVFGEPFWGPPIGYGSCWIDNTFHRHCWHYRYHR
ncbi:MAG TPA: hypothetical protein VEK31_06930 [Xanthobacteraceae bacterium]|nr:hypothetical protein [Xanthobacteraceae bacterium]